MAKTRDQKKAIIEKLSASFKDAVSVVFVHFKGLNVAQESEMRRALGAANVTYTVAKKTLIGKAIESVKFGGEMPQLDGEIALAFGKGDDSTAAARLVHEFGEKFKKAVAIVGGVFEGGFRDARGMTEIATIPSMQVLRGMFAYVINSPRQRFAVVLSKVAEAKAK